MSEFNSDEHDTLSVRCEERARAADGDRVKRGGATSQGRHRLNSTPREEQRWWCETSRSAV